MRDGGWTHWVKWQCGWGGPLKRCVATCLCVRTRSCRRGLPCRCSRGTRSCWSSTTRRFYSNNLNHWSPFCCLFYELIIIVIFCCRCEMSLEGILAEFEQLRQESERALQGKEVPVTSLGDVAILDVDVSAVPPAPQLRCSGLGVELELVGLSQSSPDRPLRGLAVQVEAARLSQDDELERRSAKLEEIKVTPKLSALVVRKCVVRHCCLCVQGELGKYGRARLKLRREVGSLMLEVSRRQSTLAAMAEEGGHLQEGRLPDLGCMRGPYIAHYPATPEAS